MHTALAGAIADLYSDTPPEAICLAKPCRDLVRKVEDVESGRELSLSDPEHRRPSRLPL